MNTPKNKTRMDVSPNGIIIVCRFWQIQQEKKRSTTVHLHLEGRSKILLAEINMYIKFGRMEDFLRQLRQYIGYLIGCQLAASCLGSSLDFVSPKFRLGD